jgi:predicted dehydrogenase
MGIDMNPSGTRHSWISTASEPPARRISRRRFLQSSTALSAAALFAGPSLLRGRDLNGKLNIGMIGLGGKSADNLKGIAGENVVALCEVDARSLDRVAAQYPNATRHQDFRRMLEQKDIDAVVVTTPDHIHTVASMAAIKFGKHVYCEKPLTHSVWEARELRKAARQYKVATQMGNGGHASDALREAVEWLQAGVIGKVREVHAWSNRPIWPQGIERPKDTPTAPDQIDWDLWIGPAPMRPYHPAYHPFKWRGWWDFGTGALGDMGCHIIDTAFWALDLGAPSTVEAESSGANEETAPTWSIVRYQFPARGALPAVKLTWHDGGKLPPRELTELPADQKLTDNGSLFIGDKGKLLFERGKPLRILPERKGFTPPPKQVPRSPGHYKEWIEACKGGSPAMSNFDYAGPLTEMVLLGNVALRVGRKIEWDSEALRVSNIPEAARFIRREYRQGWSL